MARQGLFFLPLIWILPRFLDLWGVQLAQPIADGFSFLLSVALGTAFLQKLSRLEAQTDAVAPRQPRRL